ncbi:unnamed protein product [Hydatigera taeniaeformis]|uniref:Uncharacterized protein n=1 Tax=Hydatigena taeniaeformis TaxID=6205 RepID=A0A0R3WP28_HYDTA|nr:unnamed protein product [Hydatigera taeniaeformis]
MHANRVNGASRIIYASKPDTPAYHNIPIRRASPPPKGTTIGFMQDIAASSSSESISTSITSLPQGPPIRAPEIELDVVPPASPRPFDNRAAHGNRIKFETTRPADIPYFDSTSESNFELNRPRNLTHGARNVVLRPQGERMIPQPRIGYQEEELMPRLRTPKDPDLNLSFNFQCGADPHIPPLTPETSFGIQGPASNMKIQGRTKAVDISTTTLTTDTPMGENALDDTLDTVGSLQLLRDSSPQTPPPPPPPPPALILPALNEETPATVPQNDTVRRHDFGDERESGFSSHVYEVVQDSPLNGTRGPEFGAYVSDPSNASIISRDEILRQSGRRRLIAKSKATESARGREFSTTAVIDTASTESDRQIGIEWQERSEFVITKRLVLQKVALATTDNCDGQFDLSKQVSVQVGSLIQQRLKELTDCLNMDSQTVGRGNATTNSGEFT